MALTSGQSDYKHSVQTGEHIVKNAGCCLYTIVEQTVPLGAYMLNAISLDFD